MRSKLGTKSRLAAHITALVLLILMLVYFAPPLPNGEPIPLPTPPRHRQPARTSAQPRPQTRPRQPSADARRTARPAPAAKTAQPAAPQKSETAPIAAPAEQPAKAAEEDGDHGNGVEAETDAAPPPEQPDESGSLVVAAAEDDDEDADLAPLGDASLEVLGDGIYWLDPQRDIEKELAAIPEIGTLILLAPLRGYRTAGFDHVRTEVIPADTADLSYDAAARFVHLTSSGASPIVAAALPGARGAAFFKGVYLLAHRGLELEDALREIAPELQEAGAAADEIVHRLQRLDAAALR